MWYLSDDDPCGNQTICPRNILSMNLQCRFLGLAKLCLCQWSSPAFAIDSPSVGRLSGVALLTVSRIHLADYWWLRSASRINTAFRKMLRARFTNLGCVLILPFATNVITPIFSVFQHWYLGFFVVHPKDLTNTGCWNGPQLYTAICHRDPDVDWHKAEANPH